MSVTRIPIEEMPSKSKVAIYRLPGGGGFLWGVATSRNLSLDLPGQAADALAVIDGYLTDAPADQLKIVALPDAPEGAEIASVDVVIRLRRRES